VNPFDDMTDEQLVDLEQSLYEDEVHGDGDWFQRDRVLWEMNRRGLMNHPHIGEFRTPDEVHRMCAARMEMVDQLPVELRAKLNRDGRL